jgi:hypothetical protein
VSIVVVMPSRGRPERAAEAVQAILDTAVLSDTRVWLAVDADDPALLRYDALAVGRVTEVILAPDETGDLTRATNAVSMRLAADDPTAVIGNLGDDHVCRTVGWDRSVADALARPGIAYGDDLIHGANLPTAPFISAQIVRALGWYAMPACRHLFIDTVWRDIGIETGTLRYLPSVVIEHLHPLVDKAEWDEGYRLANSEETTSHDRAAYERWRETAMAADVDRVQRALRGAA